MKIKFKQIMTIGLIVVLLMQLYQPARNKNYEQVSAITFTKVYNVPKNVSTILRTSCYDCHSNNTNYPWYSYMQPIRFFMESHIQEGKNKLNFDDFGNYSKRKQKSKLDEMAREIEKGKMPLSSYTLVHKNANISKNQKKVLLRWINEIKDNVPTQN